MGNIDPLGDVDIIKESEEGFDIFTKSLGPDDIYKEILLEELFKLLLQKR